MPPRSGVPKASPSTEARCAAGWRMPALPRARRRLKPPRRKPSQRLSAWPPTPPLNEPSFPRSQSALTAGAPKDAVRAADTQYERPLGVWGAVAAWCLQEDTGTIILAPEVSWLRPIVPIRFVRPAECGRWSRARRPACDGRDSVPRLLEDLGFRPDGLAGPRANVAAQRPAIGQPWPGERDR
jgi:hypothetical protein